MAQITYTDKVTGGQFTAANANEIKSAVNTNEIKRYFEPPTSGSIIDALQTFVDTNVGYTVVIGKSITDVIEIDKPLSIPSNSIIELNCELKIANGVTALLTADLNTGTNLIQVANADQLFKVGQQIVVSSDDVPLYGGGDWKLRRGGTVNWVAGVSSTTITCLWSFDTLYGAASYTVASNAKVGQYNAALYMPNVDNVTIYGNGTINGNFDNQIGASVVGVTYNPQFSEALWFGSGIATGSNQGVNIYGNIKIHDFVLSGLTHWNAGGVEGNYFDVRGLSIKAAGEKGIACIALHNSTFDDIECYDGRDEGEFALYSGNYNINLNNIRCWNNRRNGLALIDEAGTSTINISNCYLANNQGKNLGIKGSAINVTNVLIEQDLVDGSGIVIEDANDVNVSNISIINAAKLGGSMGIIRATYCTINGFNVSNSYGANRYNVVSFQDSSDVLINGLYMTDVNRVFGEYGTNTRCLIQNGYIAGYNILYKDFLGQLLFKNFYDGKLSTWFEQKEPTDLEFSQLDGVVLIDRTTSTKYRIKVDSGVLGVEAV